MCTYIQTCKEDTHTQNFFKEAGVVGYIFDPSTMKAEADTEPIISRAKRSFLPPPNCHE